MMRAEKIMRRPVYTCRHNDSLNAPAQLMWEQKCGSIPIVDPDGRLVGIVTDRDICMAAYTQGRPLSGIPVESAMARDVFSVRPDDSVDQAAKLMIEKHVRRIPVVDEENKPVGILSLKDLANESNHGGWVRDGVGKLLHGVATIVQSRWRKPRAA